MTRKMKAEKPDGPTNRILLRPDEFTVDSRREWLAEQVLFAGSPAVMAGGRMDLTWFAADLAVSLATGTRFLGRFAIPRRRRTAFCSYALPFSDVWSVARAVAAAHGADIGSSELRLPRRWLPFRTRAERQAVVSEMRGEGVEVVILDPIQAALRTGEQWGETEPEVDRLPALGDSLLAAGITPVFTHGTRWSSSTPSYGDLAALNLRDYVHQWMLLYRSGPGSASGTGTFRLAAGGHVGHDARWNVTAKAGPVGPGSDELRWEVATADVTDFTGKTPWPAAATDHGLDQIYVDQDEPMVANRGNRLTNRGGKSGR